MGFITEIRTQNELAVLEEYILHQIIGGKLRKIGNYSLKIDKWTQKKLGDVLSLTYGKGVPKDALSDGSVPVFGANGILKYCNKVLVDEPCIIVGRKGSAGAVNYSVIPCWVSDVCYYVLPGEHLNFQYCYFLLKSLHLEKLAKGIKPGLNRNEAYQLNIKLPDLSEQILIVRELNKYHDLIGSVSKVLDEKNGIQQDLTKEFAKVLVSKIREANFEFNEFIINVKDVDLMREAILKLAISGNLVPQNPKDEDVNSLLNKLKLVNKNIKDIEFMPVSHSLKSKYEIPSSWRLVPLSSIGKIIGGGTPKTSSPEYWTDDGIPWLTPADLYHKKSKYISKGRRDISEAGLKESSAQLLPKGTVLFSSRAPIGYVAISDCALATNQGFKSVVPCLAEMSDYIYYFLKAVAKDIDSSASGTTFREISGSKLETIPFPLAPLKEQKRIVEKLDKFMSLCDELELRIKENQKTADLLATTILRTPPPLIEVIKNV